MVVIRILLIFACIWLLLVLLGKQLLKFLFGQGARRGADSRKQQKQHNSRNAQASIIPDDVGNYVDYTEVKSEVKS